MTSFSDPAEQEIHRTSFTLAICAHNAIGRIHRALDALCRLEYSGTYEVLVVDNASNDGTAAFVQRWSDGLRDLRIVAEPNPGVAHARMRAVREAQHEWIVWVDDDNVLPPDYLEKADAIICRHEGVGLIAGDANLLELAPPPPWFAQVSSCYAVGKQFPAEGEQTGGSFSWGAGSMLLRSAALDLLDRHFTPMLTGRLGRYQLAGEDAEICLGLRMLGWRFIYSRELVIGHAIEPGRMTLEMLRKTAFGFGLSSITLEVYRSYFDPPLKRWIKCHDFPFLIYAATKYISSVFRFLLTRDIRARANVWASQGALAGLFSGMRPSSLLKGRFFRSIKLSSSYDAA